MRNSARAAVTLFTLGFLSGVSMGQTTKPLFWSWTAEPTTDWSDPDGRFTQIIRIYANGNTGTQAGTAMANAVAASGYSSGRVAILIQNFGNNPDPTTSYTHSLLHDDDAVTIQGVPAWPEALDTASQDLRRQPWMTYARVDMADWIQDFCDAYQARTPAVPFPDRIFFDQETALTNICGANYAYILECMAIETPTSTNRWNTEEVPGFPGKTMAELWTDDFNGAIEDQIDTSDGGFCFEEHKPIFLWYQSICQKAKDAVLGEMYDILHNEFSGVNISNYQDCRTDYLNDTFDWQKDFAIGETDPVPTRAMPRGREDKKGGNSMYNEFISNGRWFITGPSARSGDFDSPNLYTNFPDFIEPNYYLPGSPNESQWDSSLRVQRRWAEAILNSNVVSFSVSNPSAEFVPWTPMVCGNPAADSPAYEVTLDDIRRQLTMLRAKNVPEIIWWTGELDAEDAEFQYRRSRVAFEQVYYPSLTGFTIALSGTSYVYSNPEDLWYTLRRSTTTPTQVESEMWMDSVAVSYGEVDAADVNLLQCDFEDVHLPEGTHLRITQECRVDGRSSLIGVEGEVQAWNWETSEWNQIVIPDDPNDPGTYRFYVPAAPSDGIQYTRREFVFAKGDFIGTGLNLGKVRIRILHRMPGENESGGVPGFRSYFDSVQLTRLNLQTETCGLPEENLGSGGDSYAVEADNASLDVNGSGVVTDADLDFFAEQFAAATPAADYDGDGQVTSDDALDFIDDFTEEE